MSSWRLQSRKSWMMSAHLFTFFSGKWARAMSSHKSCKTRSKNPFSFHNSLRTHSGDGEEEHFETMEWNSPYGNAHFYILFFSNTSTSRLVLKVIYKCISIRSRWYRTEDAPNGLVVHFLCCVSSKKKGESQRKLFHCLFYIVFFVEMVWKPVSIQ